MKNVYNLMALFFLLMIVSCAAQKTNEFKEIILDAHTRGRSEKITILNNKVYVKTYQNERIIEISNEQLNTIVDAIKKIDLTTMENLKSPTNKRQYDGAMHTNISVKYNDKTYTSASFDYGTPPEELKILVDLLMGVVK